MLQHLVAVHVRHHDVEQNQVELLRAQQLQRLPAVVGRREVRIALALQPARERVAIVLVVVDHEERSLAGTHDAGPSGTSARILPTSRGKLDRLGIEVVASGGQRSSRVLSGPSHAKSMQ